MNYLLESKTGCPILAFKYFNFPLLDPVQPRDDMEGFKILLAVSTPELHDLMIDILDRHKLCIVTTVDQARAAFHPAFDLIICGLHFDMGRMYELLKYAKASPIVQGIPFVCVQLTGGILPLGTYKSMECAFQLLGGDLLVQVDKWRVELGDEMAFAKLRDVVHAVAPGRDRMLPS